MSITRVENLCRLTCRPHLFDRHGVGQVAHQRGMARADATQTMTMAASLFHLPCWLRWACVISVELGPVGADFQLWMIQAALVHDLLCSESVIPSVPSNPGLPLEGTRRPGTCFVGVDLGGVPTWDLSAVSPVSARPRNLVLHPFRQCLSHHGVGGTSSRQSLSCPAKHW